MTVVTAPPDSEGAPVLDDRPGAHVRPAWLLLQDVPEYRTGLITVRHGRRAAAKISG